MASLGGQERRLKGWLLAILNPSEWRGACGFPTTARGGGIVGAEQNMTGSEREGLSMAKALKETRGIWGGVCVWIVAQDARRVEALEKHSAGPKDATRYRGTQHTRDLQAAKLVQ
jgi:hypothetical protein